MSAEASIARSLHDALGGMRNVAQWFCWRLEWDAAELKYKKTPCAHDGSVYRIDAGSPQSWASYERVRQVVAMLNSQPQCADRTLQYALGFWMTADCGYWFFDLDKAVQDGAILPYAQKLCAAFPGALMEFSSSGKGLHVFGRGAVPKHRTRPTKEVKQRIAPLELEFYHQGRGVAFGLNGEATGNADTYHDAMVAQLCAQFFPPAVEGEEGEHDAPRADWRGPADDDELIRRALQAKVSAEVAFGNKPGFPQLWRGECEKSSESDMALAAHLAFWCGCDAPRIERLMRRSGLVRDKWDTHRTYLRELTIQRACDGCDAVYREPERNMAVMQQMLGTGPIPGEVVMPTQQGKVVTPEMLARVDELLDLVTQCGTYADLLNDVIPAIQSARIPPALGERLVKAVNNQLEFHGGKLPVAKLRAMLFPPVLHGSVASEAPLWVQKHCYVKDGDYFLDMENGSKMTYQGFLAEYARLMPLKDNGSRENAVDWALTRWGMRTVHRVAYRPNQGPYFDWDGLEYANTYSPASVPAVAEYTEGGIAGIAALQTHLFEMCGRRQEVFNALVYWLAHNVQRPGVKIRWSPVIKGTQGDGKTLLSNVLRAVMGYRNVGVTGNATLTNSGGFNDWAIGAALNVIEEIMLTGKERHRLYNAMKEFISNDVVNINGKGVKTYSAFNATNHIAFTNHNDAIPLDAGDRRWFVIYTPWGSLREMMNYCGLEPEEWAARTRAIDRAWREHGGELRAWFLSREIATLDINGSAPKTTERMRMISSGRDELESLARGIIEEGATGVGPNVLSSSCLSAILKIRAMLHDFEVPRTSALSHMLTRMGFSRLEREIKWKGQAHSIWVRNGWEDCEPDQVRLELDQPSSYCRPA